MSAKNEVKQRMFSPSRDVREFKQLDTIDVDKVKNKIKIPMLPLNSILINKVKIKTVQNTLREKKLNTINHDTIQVNKSAKISSKKNNFLINYANSCKNSNRERYNTNEKSKDKIKKTTPVITKRDEILSNATDRIQNVMSNLKKEIENMDDILKNYKDEMKNIKLELAGSSS